MLISLVSRGQSQWFSDYSSLVSQISLIRNIPRHIVTSVTQLWTLQSQVSTSSHPARDHAEDNGVVMQRLWSIVATTMVDLVCCGGGVLEIWPCSTLARPARPWRHISRVNTKCGHGEQDLHQSAVTKLVKLQWKDGRVR